MKVVTAEEIKKIEQIAIKEYGISELILMENAGVEVSKIVKCHIGDINNIFTVLSMRSIIHYLILGR